jgi:hypothetical protein
MNYFKAILAAILLSGSISAAQAEDFDWGTLNEGRSEFLHEVTPGSFLNKIHFKIEQLSNSDFGVGSLSFTLRGIPYFDIQDMSMSLFDSMGNKFGSGVDFSVSALASGDYYLQVAGSATGTAGGIYGGSIAMASLPVPEPGMGSSLMAGLLMLAFMAARRRDIQ